MDIYAFVRRSLDHARANVGSDPDPIYTGTMLSPIAPTSSVRASAKDRAAIQLAIYDAHVERTSPLGQMRATA